MMQHPTTEQLIDYIHGEVQPQIDALIHAHLAGCAPCRAEHSLEVSLSEALRSAAAAEALELPSTVKANIWATIRSAEPGPFARLSAFLRPALALPLAAAIVLGAYLALPNHRGPSGPSVDAAYYLDQHAAQMLEIPLSDRSNAPSSTLELASDQSFNSAGPAPLIERAEAAATGTDAVR